MSVLDFLPWVSLVAGLSGSLHCAGMCGGLVTASCSNGTDVVRYQFGRLAGYMVLAGIGAAIGSVLKTAYHPALSLFTAVMLGGFFILWGIESYLGKKTNLSSKVSSKIGRLSGAFYGKIWKRFIYKNETMTKSFFTGLASIFLPCGLLYGVVLSQAALAHSASEIAHVFFSMFFFWLGTLPAMIFAPQLFKKILIPLKERLPKVFAMGLILIGLVTIGVRVKDVDSAWAGEKAGGTKTMSAPRCH